jgi:hypothetical protein
VVIDPLTRARGCDRCTAPIMVKIESSAGLVELCLACTLRWFPGRDAAWFEERHAPFRDHLGDRIKAAWEREKAAHDRAIAEEARRLRAGQS